MTGFDSSGQASVHTYIPTGARIPRKSEDVRKAVDRMEKATQRTPEKLFLNSK
jgi:hypothetical protein